MFSSTNNLLPIYTAIIIYILYKIFTRNFDYWSKRNVPFIKPIPIFGNFMAPLFFQSNIGHWLAKLYQEIQEPFFGIWIFNSPRLIVRSPELIKAILVRDFNYFSDRTIFSDKGIDAISANILFAAKNPLWKDLRVKMTPAFTSGKLRNMFDLINKAGEDLKTYLGSVSVQRECEDCKEVSAKFSTDVLTSTAFGLEGKCFDDEDSPYRVAGRKLFDFDLLQGFKTSCYFFIPSAVARLKFKFLNAEAYAFLRDVFWQTIKERENGKYLRNDLIDILVQMRRNGDECGVENFTGDRVVAQAIQFFTAGFETTSSTIAFTLYELCLNAKIQNRLRGEIRDGLKNENQITYEMVNKMKYLHCVVSETLRKYPVLPFLDRTCTENYKVPNTNLILEKGTSVYIPMIGLHKDPKYFKDPENFDPDRFADGNVQKIPQYAYMPFGEGPHNCIGARFGLLVTKLGLVHILSDFEVERTKETPVPIKFNTKSFILQSVVGLPMRFKKIPAS